MNAPPSNGKLTNPRSRANRWVALCLVVCSTASFGAWRVSEAATAVATDDLWAEATDYGWGYESTAEAPGVTLDLRQPEGVAPNAGAFDELDYELDEEVVLSQSLAPSLNAARTPARAPTSRQTVARRRTAASTTLSASLASVPFMIGDTGAGTCFSLRGIVTVDVSHPSLTCNRLNISENNTALPIDRFYYSYRHFNNASGIHAFQYMEKYDYDRHMLGMERTFWDGMASVEVRTPIEERLNSNMLTLISPTDGVVDVLTGSKDREVGLGNISIVTKVLLMEREAFALSTGLGVTLPTARDVNYDIGVRDTIIFPIAPGVTGDTVSTFTNTFENETVYLSPFMAWLWAPQSRWYHQGFLQVEVAANPSTLITDGGGFTDFYFEGNPIGNVVFTTPNFMPTQTELFAQTLLRANLGVGYRLGDLNGRGFIRNVRALGEMHYTTTLQRGKLSEIAIEELGVGAYFSQTAAAGNANPRADILNAALGLSGEVGRFVVTNGFVAPLRTGHDRGYDFEYNLQVQLPY